MVKISIRAASVIVRRCQICGRFDAQQIRLGSERGGKVPGTWLPFVQRVEVAA